MNVDLVDQFIACVSAKSEFQKKYLGDLELTMQEREELSNILMFFQKVQKQSFDELVDAYLFINEMVMEEQYYFVKNGSYRNHLFAEVNAQVYQNEDYMKKYMTGLVLSDYIWTQHIKIIRYFEEEISQFGKGERYLEIGPGFGQFLVRAVKSEYWNEYLAVDISPVSVENCKNYLKYSELSEEPVKVITQDFFQFESQMKFDCIVCGEVLEHIENPFLMLQKICSLLSADGQAFVTTVINSPAVDHIFLFSTVQEVIDFAQRAGFIVKEYICTTAGKMSIEKAEKRRFSMNIALVLQKR